MGAWTGGYSKWNTETVSRPPPARMIKPVSPVSLSSSPNGVETLHSATQSCRYLGGTIDLFVLALRLHTTSEL